MRLLKYKVNKFRSVKGTEWIDVDQWNCLVGLNESGKTNLLLPLWKFNPADDATEIDLHIRNPRSDGAGSLLSSGQGFAGIVVRGGPVLFESIHH